MFPIPAPPKTPVRIRRAQFHPFTRQRPGSNFLSFVVAVREDRELDADTIRYEDGVFVASTWARELPGLPKERNFHGVSLAVAHVTGMAAALLATGVAKSEIADRLRHR